MIDVLLFLLRLLPAQPLSASIEILDPAEVWPRLTACMEGPGVIVGQECEVFDVNEYLGPGRVGAFDNDVDLEDVASWQRVR